ncbi:MAG: helix-turn-helix transcriptional regulator [Planctomycetes bacterium]|nr:helix-turn-helix transcriptional regulator [Planctomycetota bacterium]
MVISGNAWDWENEEQKTKMEEEITKENCGEKLKLIRMILEISRRELAKTLGVRESTIGRLERKKTLPSQDFMSKLQGLQLVGYATFRKLSKTDKEKISEFIGTGAGVAGGVGASVAAVSVAGSVGGLSASGITSGLAAVGGSMLGGIITAAFLPIAVGALGYGAIKGVKKICEANNLSCKKLDNRWEITKEDHKENEED